MILAVSLYSKVIKTQLKNDSSKWYLWQNRLNQYLLLCMLCPYIIFKQTKMDFSDFHFEKKYFQKYTDGVFSLALRYYKILIMNLAVGDEIWLNFSFFINWYWIMNCWIIVININGTKFYLNSDKSQSVATSKSYKIGSKFLTFC